jgi:hypothetical protein
VERLIELRAAARKSRELRGGRPHPRPAGRRRRDPGGPARPHPLAPCGVAATLRYGQKATVRTPVALRVLDRAHAGSRDSHN